MITEIGQKNFGRSVGDNSGYGSYRPVSNPFLVRKTAFSPRQCQEMCNIIVNRTKLTGNYVRACYMSVTVVIPLSCYHITSNTMALPHVRGRIKDNPGQVVCQYPNMGPTFYFYIVSPWTTLQDPCSIFTVITSRIRVVHSVLYYM